MREPLVAWAGDCRLRGDVDLRDGRLSDQVNESDLLTFFGATLEALDDGHEVSVEELEVERRELHLIEVEGRQGDPIRRLRTILEPVRMEIGPFLVSGNLHRPPAAQPLAALTSWHRFVPLTDARIALADGSRPSIAKPVVLVNRERIRKTEPLDSVARWADDVPEVDPAMAGGSAA